MFSYNILLLFFLMSGTLSDIPGRPSDLPCKKTDVKCTTRLVQWMYSSTVPGIPGKGIETSDPLFQELIEGRLPYVRYNLKKTNIEGFKTCKINSASVNADISSLRMDMLCRRFHMDGDYEIDGKLLNYPIKGKGPYYVDATNYHMLLDVEIKFYEQSSKQHVAYKKFNFTAELMGEMDLEMRNLFGGNKQLSDVVHQFAKNNSKLFSSLLQYPVISANIKLFINSFNKLFKFIPIDELLQI